jgi:hypothetical protein
VDWLDQNKFLFDVSGKVASPAVMATATGKALST